MCWILIFLFNIVLFSNVSGKNVEFRKPRFISGTHTVTVVETNTLTRLVHSSCVQVDATLPPCRSYRFLNFHQFLQNQSNSYPQPDAKLEPKVEGTPLGWGEYFGIFAPTVTVKQTRLVTTEITDPNIVVTYVARGCRPARLPSNIDRCPGETQIVAVDQVLPTSTVVPTPTIPTSTPINTRLIEVPQGTLPISDGNENQINNNLEASEGVGDLEANRQPRATDPLLL